MHVRHAATDNRSGILSELIGPFPSRSQRRWTQFERGAPDFWGELDRKCLLQMGARDEGHSNNAVRGSVSAAHVSSIAHGIPTPHSAYNRTRSRRAEPKRVAKIAGTNRNEHSLAAQGD
jgi:hypothetical protein